MATKAKDQSRPLGPKVADSTHRFLEGYFSSRNGGATYILEAFPALFRASLDDMKGTFSREELSLILDVFNGTMLTGMIAGQHLKANVADGIALEALDRKWSTKKEDLLHKIAARSNFELACLEVWANGFWYAANSPAHHEPEDFENYLKTLL